MTSVMHTNDVEQPRPRTAMKFKGAAASKWADKQSQPSPTTSTFSTGDVQRRISSSSSSLIGPREENVCEDCRSKEEDPNYFYYESAYVDTRDTLEQDAAQISPSTATSSPIVATPAAEEWTPVEDRQWRTFDDSKIDNTPQKHGHAISTDSGWHGDHAPVRNNQPTTFKESASTAESDGWAAWQESSSVRNAGEEAYKARIGLNIRGLASAPTPSTHLRQTSTARPTPLLDRISAPPSSDQVRPSPTPEEPSKGSRPLHFCEDPPLPVHSDGQGPTQQHQEGAGDSKNDDGWDAWNPSASATTGQAAFEARMRLRTSDFNQSSLPATAMHNITSTRRRNSIVSTGSSARTPSAVVHSAVSEISDHNSQTGTEASQSQTPATITADDDPWTAWQESDNAKTGAAAFEARKNMDRAAFQNSRAEHQRAVKAASSSSPAQQTSPASSKKSRRNKVCKSQPPKSSPPQSSQQGYRPTSGKTLLGSSSKQAAGSMTAKGVPPNKTVNANSTGSLGISQPSATRDAQGLFKPQWTTVSKNASGQSLATADAIVADAHTVRKQAVATASQALQSWLPQQAPLIDFDSELSAAPDGTVVSKPACPTVFEGLAGDLLDLDFNVPVLLPVSAVSLSPSSC